MKASILDLRRRMKEVLRALDRNQPVTILYRGKPKGVIYPGDHKRRAAGRAAEHAAFGMWRDRADMQDVEHAIRKLRRGRFDAV